MQEFCFRGPKEIAAETREFLNFGVIIVKRQI